MDENFDLQGVIDKAKEMFSGDEGKAQLQGLMDMFSTEPEKEKADEGTGFDPAMLFKMQKIMSAMNNNEVSDKARLLMSLKPFLGAARREKVDNAVRLMNMSKVLAAFREK